MAACASSSAAARVQNFGIPPEHLFEFWDWVGGRYSVCSSVGALPLSLKYGYGMFDRFLAGARAVDIHFQVRHQLKYLVKWWWGVIRCSACLKW